MLNKRKLRIHIYICGFLFILFSLILSDTLCFGTSRYEIKRGVAHGEFHIQGYSSAGALGTLTFFNVGSMAEESSLSYVDDAYISLDDGDWNGKPYQLKGKFSGGPNGVATFTADNDYTFNVQLKNGRVFEVNQPGVWINMTVSDPSIFEQEEEDGFFHEEYDPNVPLEDSGIKIAHRDGQLEIACPPDLEAWDILKEGRIIYTHCHIKTGEDSTVRLDFPDMTSFKMRPETEIVIKSPPKQSKINLIAGKIWANVKKMVKDGTMEVHGSQAVAGIKGTTFIMEETGTGTKLKVIEGVVTFNANANEESRDVSVGEEINAINGKLGEIVKFDITAENKLWETITTNNQIKSDKTNTEIKKPTQTKFIIGSIIVFLIIIMIVVSVIKKKNKIKTN